MKNKLLLFTTLLVVHFNSIQAQVIEECATHTIHKKLMTENPTYANRVIENERLLKGLPEDQTRDNSAVVLQIPVVVHIVHTGQAVGVGANISMTQINSAIDNLNNRFRNLHGQSVDTEIEFVLAQRDPDGNATTGVVRVDGSGVTNYSASGVDAGGGVGADEVTVKNLSRWPNTNYYNIWVVTEIEGNNGGAGIQGYAYYPGAIPAVDGTIIMHTCFGTTGTVNSWNNQGRTLVHEIGHAFNLRHTFQGDDSDNDGVADQCPADIDCDSGDCVADTEPHQRAASNCPVGANSCGTTIDPLSANFMNYSGQACALAFTSGQTTRMRDAITLFRPNLTTSLGGTAPAVSSVATADCTPSSSLEGPTSGIGILRMALNNIDMVSAPAAFEGGYIDHTEHQTIEVDEGSSYSITIENFPAGNLEDVAVFIDYNNDGDFLDAGETVFTSQNNTVHNGTIDIPSSGATTGTLLRMRVIDDFANNTITGSCYNPQYGQIEDYAITIRSTLSIQESQIQNIVAYPNPTANIINVRGLSQDQIFKIYTISGRLIMSEKIRLNDPRIDVTKLSSGIYFLNINSNTIKIIRK